MMLSKKRADEENEELGKLREEISEFQKLADKNYYQEMIKYWIFGMLIILGTALVVWIFSHFVTLPQSSIEPSKIEELAPVIFNATVTVNGVIIGFVPVCSFFFSREIRENQHEVIQEWEQKKKESEGERQNLINISYSFQFTAWHNLRSGVLKYTRTYVGTSIFLQVYLVILYAVMSADKMVPFYLFFNIVFLTIIFVGLFPLINVALYKPALRVVRIGIVEKEFIGIVPED